MSKGTSSKPFIPSYTTFYFKHDKQSSFVEDLHDMYTKRYNMITKKGYKGLGLGVNEHDIKYPVHIPSKIYLHGVGCSNSQIKEGDVNHHPPLHKFLPTPTLDNSGIH